MLKKGAKIEWGMLEIFIVLSILLNILAFAGMLSAEFEWFKWILSALLIAAIFYEAKPSSILFGHEKPGYDFVIILAYVIYLVKDFVGGAAVIIEEHSHFMFPAMQEFMVWIASNAAILNIFSLYTATILILIITIWMTFTYEIRKPSLLHAIHEDIGISRTPLIIFKRFFFIFLALEFFYLFVFNLMVQWLGMAIDDPIVIISIFVVIFLLFRQKHIFNRENRVSEKVVDLAETLEHFYRKLILMFHYKKTLPLAISGILVLHAMTDIFVYLLPYLFPFVRITFYSGLGIESTFSFASASITKIIAYLFNIAGVLLLLGLPLLIWFGFFYHKSFVLKKYISAFAITSYSTLLLVPYFKLEPIILSNIRGVIIKPVGFHFPLTHINLNSALLISVLAGIVVLFFNKKLNKYISNIILLGSTGFFAYYIFLWGKSTALYFNNVGQYSIQAGFHFASIIFYFFMALTLMLYVLGYLFLLSETIAEIINAKWSNPIDEEIKLLRKATHRKKQK